jgi:hypothetical protein
VRKRERGFALLIVFLMAAVVAFTLYRQLPRVAFESQRDKEELLMERGQQYQRAIQLYVFANRRFPVKIEDLEDTNAKRYLRRRYVDPLTGKDEWRLIHVGVGGILTDSLVQKPPLPGANGAAAGQLAGNQPGGNQPAGNANSSGQDGPPQQVNAAVLRRPSDRPLVQDPGFIPPNPDLNDDPSKWPAITLLPAGQSNPGQPNPGQPNGIQPGNPGFNPQLAGQYLPGQPAPGFQQGQPAAGQQFGQPLPGQFPGQQFPGQQFPGQVPGQQFLGQPQNAAAPGGFQPGAPGQLPGQPGFNPQSANQNILGQNNIGQNQVRIGPDGQFIPVTSPPGQVGSAPTGDVQTTQTPQQFQPGGVPAAGGPGGTPNPAVQMINDMLTRPTNQNPPNAAVNTGIAGGIAGVASTYSAPSIKVYKERQKYNEWEFVFEMAQPRRINFNGNPLGNNPSNTPTQNPPLTPAQPQPQP